MLRSTPPQCSDCCVERCLCPDESIIIAPFLPCRPSSPSTTASLYQRTFPITLKLIAHRIPISGRNHPQLIPLIALSSIAPSRFPPSTPPKSLYPLTGSIN